MTASVEIVPAGAGWVDCKLSLGDRTFTLGGISDTTDALGDLVRLALMIATGAYRTTVSFDREPAEWRIVAISLTDASGNGPVSVAVYSFPDVADAPLSEGMLAFTGDCGARELAHAILDGVRAALVDPANDFAEPVEALRVLQLALA
jgi:hypothetical protein